MMNEVARRIWIGRPVREFYWRCPHCGHANQDNLGSAYAFFEKGICVAEGLPCFQCGGEALISFRITMTAGGIMTGIAIDEVRGLNGKANNGV